MGYGSREIAGKAQFNGERLEASWAGGQIVCVCVCAVQISLAR